MPHAFRHADAIIAPLHYAMPPMPLRHAARYATPLRYYAMLLRAIADFTCYVDC